MVGEGGCDMSGRQSAMVFVENWLFNEREEQVMTSSRICSVENVDSLIGFKAKHTLTTCKVFVITICVFFHGLSGRIHRLCCPMQLSRSYTT